MKQRRATQQLADRFVPAAVAAATICILAFSNVRSDLWLISGRPAAALLAMYAAVAASLAAAPHLWWLHRIGFPLGIIAWLGRSGGFAERAFNADTLDQTLLFVANSIERVLIVVLLAFWHTTVITRRTLEGMMR